MKRAPGLVAAVAAVATTLLAFGIARPALSQDEPKELEGEKAFAHPSVSVVLKAAELFRSGKVDAGMALYTASEQAGWKESTDRAETSALKRERSPDPKLLAEAIRKGGKLTLYAAEGQLQVPMPDRAMAVAWLALEKGSWRLTGGPMVIANAQDPAKEERFHGAEMHAHPVYALALTYVDALHSTKDDAFMKLATRKAQERWRAEPASERAESAAYRRRTIPKRAALEASLKEGGYIVVEDDVRASLVVLSVSQASTGPGSVTSTSSTLSLPFELEDGAWKLAQ